jgi:zona occludens toxin
MAINAYTGLMGSGKSYEVVSSVIVPAIEAGRRVVTNIDGINPQAIHDYILKRSKLTADQLGEIVTFTNEDIAATNFFPSEDDPHSESNVTILKAGDLLAVDECWKFWSTDNKISDEHMTFFRMHRHYTHPITGVSCDIALMIQDLGTLHRKLRAVIEMSTRTIKLKALGFAKQYRIEIYEGNKLAKKYHLDTFNKSYKSDIFPLYKSYAAGSGNEKAMDKRQNILMNPRLWIGTVIALILSVVIVWYAMGFFQGKYHKGVTPATSATGAQSQAAVKPSQANFSNDWRIAGRYEASGQNWTVLVNALGKLRVESPSAFSNSGYAQIAEIDGQKVTVWSGVSSGGLFQPPPAPAPPPPTAPR